MTDTTLQLHDDRKLGYAEYGLPDSKPVLFMHGFGDSHLFAQLFDADARRTEDHHSLYGRCADIVVS